MRLIDADANIETMKKCAENPENEQALLCYRYAQRILEEAPTVLAAPRWVRCEEELPKENGFYLVAVNAPYKGINVYEYKPCNDMFHENENKWVRENGCYILNHFVTHWMPIEPPKDKEE